MFTIVAESTRKVFSATAAVAIVSFAGLALDQSYLASAPRGTIEVGEPTAIDTVELAAVQLPEVVVLGKREAGTQLATTQLPEIVVVAKRVASLAAKDDGKRAPASPTIYAGF